MVWWPLPGLRQRLTTDLLLDWQAGIHNLNQVLAYTLQFIPAVAAANDALARSHTGELLERVALLAQAPFDWGLLRYGSAPLGNGLRRKFITGLLFFPDRWQARYPIEPRLDTPARAACAGFWYWHDEQTQAAERAFAVTRELPHGAELHAIASLLHAGAHITTLDNLPAWAKSAAVLHRLPEPPLRPGTVRALITLAEAAREATIARHAHAPVVRSAALGRGSAAVQRLLEEGRAICPDPEWPLLAAVARAWQPLFAHAGGAAGELVLRQPAGNPYQGFSGLPVEGPGFVGRHDILARIETCLSAGRAPALFLYGHRRMGKTSILRNLGQALAGDLLVPLDMQNSALGGHTGGLLLDVAEGVQRAAVAAGLLAPTPLAAQAFTDPDAARRALNALLEQVATVLPAGRRMVLAVDEFEHIEQGIQQGRLDPALLFYLRSLIQGHTWLGLIFAGLHTLEEMGADYRNAFFGQAEPVRVGYLSEPEARRLITNPHPDFSLDYEPELVAQIIRLTHGQPYLIQRLCWELVNRWNARFLAGETGPERRLCLADLNEEVLDRDFFDSATYYFEGVWNNVTDGERTLLAALAPLPDGLPRASLEERFGSVAVGRDLALLERHDVVAVEAGTVRFASELMRRWVAQVPSADGACGVAEAMRGHRGTVR